MSDVTLNSAECAVILSELADKMGLNVMLSSPTLFNAIAKLSGNFNYNHTASAPISLQSSVTLERWTILAIDDSFVNCIKAIRILTGYGLKEAKDLAESLGARQNGRMDINCFDLDITMNFNEAHMALRDVAYLYML